MPGEQKRRSTRGYGSDRVPCGGRKQSLLLLAGLLSAGRAEPTITLVGPSARLGYVLEHLFVVIFHLLAATLAIALDEAEFAHSHN